MALSWYNPLSWPGKAVDAVVDAGDFVAGKLTGIDDKPKMVVVDSDGQPTGEERPATETEQAGTGQEGVGVPPGSDPPAATPESATDASGSADSHAIFNDQIYLLDYYAQEGFSEGRKVPCPQVPNEVPFDFINEVTQTSVAAIQNWMHNITPHEYAQLVPQISLSILKISTMTEFAVPLSNNSDIEGALSEDYWYTTKNIGLKSFNMKLDGNSNPVGGKIYNINLSMIFDSINTFFGPIGHSALHYSDIFRSQSPAGSAGNDYKLKLSVSYSGPQEIMEKYRLTEPGQIYTSYLTLITTKLKLDENLKAQVDVLFQGYEESMLSNNTLFDFLKLKIEEAQKAAELAIGSAVAAAAANKRVARLDNDAAKEAILGAAANEAAILGIIQQANREAAAEPPRPDGMSDADWAKQVDRNRARRSVLLQAAKAANGEAGFRPLSEQQKAQNAGHTASGDVAAGAPVPHTYSNAGELSPVEEAALAKAIHQRIINGEPLDDLGGGFVSQYLADPAASTAQIKAANALTESRNNTIAAGLREAKSRSGAAVQQIRMTQLRAALDDLCFGPQHDKVWQKQELNKDQLQKYMDGLASGNTVKDFLSQQGVTVGGTNPAATPATEGAANPNAPGSAPAPGGTTVPAGQNPGPAAPAGGSGTAESAQALAAASAGADAANAKVVEIENQQRALQATYDNAAPNSQAQKDANAAKTALDAPLMAARVAAAAAVKARADANGNLTSLGTKAEIQAKLTGFKVVEYIYLGDFVSLIMKRLISTAGGINARTKPILERTRLLLTKIALASTPMSVTKAVPLYKLPISKLQIQKWLADTLYGNFRTTITLFEAFRKLTNIISLAQQRKARIMSEESKIQYTVRFIPYAMIEAGSSYQLATSRNNEDLIKHCLIFSTKDVGQAFTADMDGSYTSNIAARIPHFFIGGQAYSVVKKFDISEIQDEDIMKVQMEKMRAAGSKADHIAALFEISLTMMGTPFFQLGQFFYVEAPTVRLGEGSAKHWFHLEGYYSVKDLSHEYTAGGGYVTKIKGYLQAPAVGSGAVTIMTAKEFADSEVAAAMAENPNMTADEQRDLHKLAFDEQEEKLDATAREDAARLNQEAAEAADALKSLALPAPPVVIDAAGQAAIKAAGEEAYNAKLAELREANGDDAEQYDELAKMEAESAREAAEDKATIEQQAKAEEAAKAAAAAGGTPAQPAANAPAEEPAATPSN